MAHSKWRRLVLDLTPAIDVIMILLFGVMINSVERTKADTSQARHQAEQALAQSQTDAQARAQAQERAEALAAVNQQLRAQLAEAEDGLKQAQSATRKLTTKIFEQKMSMAQAMAKILQLNNSDRLALHKQLDRVAEGSREQFDKLVAELQHEQQPGKVYQAIRRILEMQKVFTFIDLHLDAQDYLTINADARLLKNFVVYGKSPEDIEHEIRATLEPVNFTQIVLILFSYEGLARDLTVEDTEAAINLLLARLRARTANQGVCFRYGRVGLVDLPPIGIEKE